MTALGKIINWGITENQELPNKYILVFPVFIILL